MRERARASERDRDRKKAVVWGLVGLVRGVECGRTALPGQILCPRDIWLSAFFGGRSLWIGARSWGRKRLVSNQPVCRRLWVYHIRMKLNQKYDFVWNNWRTTKCWTLNYTRICLESDNWICLNHLSPVFCWLRYNLATAVKWAEQLITHGWEFCSNKLQCNAWAISNKTALGIFVIFHWAVVPKLDLMGKQLWMATLMHAAFVLGGKNAHSCFSFQ